MIFPGRRVIAAWVATLACGLAAAQAGDAAPAAASGGPPPAGQPATPPAYALDAGHTFVHWEVLHMGTSTTRGRIDRLAGAVQFDAKRQTVDVSIVADTASVSTGLPAFDTVMRGPQLLAAAQHPQAYFTATRGQWDGGQLRRIDGEFTLRGVSRPLTLRALRFRCGLNPLFGREVCGGDFEGSFKRSDHGMSLALPMVADEVRLLVQVEAVRQP